MSYIPILIIRKENLMEHITIFESEQYSGDEDVKKVAEYLLEISKYEPMKFFEGELIICHPEFASFNSLVRTRLAELGVDFHEDQ